MSAFVRSDAAEKTRRLECRHVLRDRSARYAKHFRQFLRGNVWISGNRIKYFL